MPPARQALPRICAIQSMTVPYSHVILQTRLPAGRWPKSPCPSGCCRQFWNGFDGCAYLRRCPDDTQEGRDSRRMRGRRGRSGPTGRNGPSERRLEQHQATRGHPGNPGSVPLTWFPHCVSGSHNVVVPRTHNRSRATVPPAQLTFDLSTCASSGPFSRHDPLWSCATHTSPAYEVHPARTLLGVLAEPSGVIYNSISRNLNLTRCILGFGPSKQALHSTT